MALDLRPDRRADAGGPLRGAAIIEAVKAAVVPIAYSSHRELSQQVPFELQRCHARPAKLLKKPLEIAPTLIQ